MKIYFWAMCAIVVYEIASASTGFAYDAPEYLILARHRDSNGQLLAGPTQHQPQPSVIQKTVIPAQPKTYERRSTDWGMKAQEVKLNEPVQPLWELHSPILEDYEQRVAYRSQIEGIDASLTYTFYEDKLAQANYWFEPKHEDAVEYVHDFHTVKNWIIQSYGKPASVQEIWLDDLYRYDPSLWGQAVLRGHLKIVAEWRNDTTNITLLLDGGDDTIGLMADFDSAVVVPPAPKEAGLEEAHDWEESSIEATPVMETQSPVGETSSETGAQESRSDRTL